MKKNDFLASSFGFLFYLFINYSCEIICLSFFTHADDDKVAFGVTFAKLRGLIKCGDTIVILTDKYSRIEYILYDN